MQASTACRPAPRCSVISSRCDAAAFPAIRPGRLSSHDRIFHGQRIASTDLADDWRDAFRANPKACGRNARANGNTFNSSAQVRSCAGHGSHPVKWFAKYLPAPFPIYRDRVRQDWHRRLPVAVAERSSAGSYSLDHAQGRLAAQPCPFQPGAENFEASIGATFRNWKSSPKRRHCPTCSIVSKLADLLLRMDPRIEPTCYRCAVVSHGELRALRLISDIVRLGRVQTVEQTRLILDRGEVPADPDTLYVDCSAALSKCLRLFASSKTTRSTFSWFATCQPLFSAALIGWVESHVADSSEKNALCDPVPSPEAPVDWLRMWAATLRNTSRWRRRPDLDAWLRDCRLNSMNAFLRGVRPDDKKKFALLKRAGETGAAAAARIPDLLSA